MRAASRSSPGTTLETVNGDGSQGILLQAPHPVDP